VKLTELKPQLGRVVNGAFGILACTVLVVAFPTVVKGTIDQVIAAGHRVPIHAGDRCHRCQRIITDRSVAAEGIGTAGVGVRQFRNVACMLKYLNDTNEKLDILVTDHTSGRFVRPQGTSFVRTTIDRRTGEEGYVAFYHPWSASGFAAKHRAPVQDWETVQAMERVHSLAE
jgi:hypothetical protein